MYNKCMLWATLFFTELIFLFYISKKLTKTISFRIYQMTGSKKSATHLLAFLFLPGTTIHEISHAITAMVLGVHVGKITLFPEIEGKYIKLGSVEIARTDMIRRFMIGTAPFFWGTTLLLSLLFFTEKYALYTTPWIFLIVYGIFEIGNTMFSSKKDMEGAIKLLFIVVLGISILYLLNIQIRSEDIVTLLQHRDINRLFYQGCIYLMLPIMLDIILIGILSFRSSRQR